MRSAHNIAVEALAQDIGIFALHAPRHGLPRKWKGLVAIKTTQLDDFAIQ